MGSPTAGASTPLSIDSLSEEFSDETILFLADYTILESQPSSSLLRHAQMLAFTSLVMLLIISVSAIAVMESDSALFEEVRLRVKAVPLLSTENSRSLNGYRSLVVIIRLFQVKSWPPMVILRREYYHPVKSFISVRMSLDH